MDFWKNNLQTHFSNIIHQIYKPKLFNNKNPFCSVSQKNNNDDLGLSTAEIKKRLAGIRVYNVSNYSENTCAPKSGDGDMYLQLYYFSQPDALDFLHNTNTFSSKIHPHDFVVLDSPLTRVLDFYEKNLRVRLVPDLSQVRSAIKETKESRSFSGIPLFQSKYLQWDGGNGKKYRPAFLRREDLEYNRKKLLTPAQKKKDVIQVTALEDVILEMKDSTTSKSNDIFVLGPSMSLTWFQEQNEKK